MVLLQNFHCQGIYSNTPCSLTFMNHDEVSVLVKFSVTLPQTSVKSNDPWDLLSCRWEWLESKRYVDRLLIRIYTSTWIRCGYLLFYRLNGIIRYTYLKLHGVQSYIYSVGIFNIDVILISLFSPIWTSFVNILCFYFFHQI